MAENVRHVPFDQRISPALQTVIEPERLSVIARRMLRQEAAQPPEPGSPSAIYWATYEGALTPPPAPEPAPPLSLVQDSIMNLTALGRNTSQIARMLRLPRANIQEEEAQLIDQFDALSPLILITAAFRHKFWLPKTELYDANLPDPVVPRIDYLAARAAKVALVEDDLTALQLLANGENYSSIDSQLDDPTDHFRNVRLPMLLWRVGARSTPHLVRIAAEAQLITVQAASDRASRPRPQETAALEMLTLGYSRPEIARIMQIRETGVTYRLARAIHTLESQNQCNAVSAAHALGLWASAIEPHT